MDKKVFAKAFWELIPDVNSDMLEISGAGLRSYVAVSLVDFDISKKWLISQ